MTDLGDGEGRLRALTDIDSTLLVEAAAGTGKTALMVGRLTMMLVRGIDPSNVAAITFTELAASELSTRVHRFIEELLGGRVPEAMRVALPKGLDASQRDRLSAAASKIDELTASTIHGFCQNIIRQYAVEADIDPGTKVMDAVEADAAFDAVFDRWFRRRLGAAAAPSDPIITLSRDDPQRVVETLRGLARFRRDHRTAKPVPIDLSGRPDIDLAAAVADFRRWLGSNLEERGTAEIVGELETLASFYSGAFDLPPPFARLWEFAHPPKLNCMRRNTFDLMPPRRKSAWKRVAGKQNGERLNAEAEQLFENVDASYRTLIGSVATALVAILSEEIDEVLEAYSEFKRAAAVLDFDDLLYRACTMLREHETVRQALGARYKHILIDELQDTDPIQAEILFRIASENRTNRWQDGAVRAGALFLVGDPKQAIYQFRGANAGSYGQARAAIEKRWPENIVQITANFRSRPGILTHVNHCFKGPFSAAGQAGYVPLSPTLDDDGNSLPSVAKIMIDLPHDARAEEIRQAEAHAVAEVCARLVGNLKVRNAEGVEGPLAPGGLALLAPTGTELWHYESALEERGLPIASQAGKGLFRRQEVQDLVSLTRVLADAGDVLAFGALMRGPLVGLSEEELLDITLALPTGADAPSRQVFFSLFTDPADVPHPVAAQTLAILRDLRSRARVTTPALLLAEAIERLSVRAILAGRGSDRSARAVANIEVLLERARSYGVKGLKRFAGDISREWASGVAASEGRVDADGDAIELVTIHSSKGLEWPVVIPINTATQIRSREQFVHRPADNTMHWVLGDVVPPGLQSALEADEADAARERERLWYVACTRARDLLVIPDLQAAGARSWARVINLNHASVPVLDVSSFDRARLIVEPDPPNLQNSETFAQENVTIDTAAASVRWVRPSERDTDRMTVVEVIAVADDAPEVELPVGAGRIRGLLLHKLMEEVLTGEVQDDLNHLTQRARTLVDELPVDQADARMAPDPQEVAATIRRTLNLSEIAAMRPRLIPEFPVQASLSLASGTVAVTGRADAVELVQGRPRVIVDWKSDVAPTEQDTREHANQLEYYLAGLDAQRGLLVYMTSGVVRSVDGSGTSKVNT